MLCPRESGRYISERSEHVSINTGNIEAAAVKIYERMTIEEYSAAKWKQWPLHPKQLTKETVDWIFVVDSLNFSFWLPGDKQFQLNYRGKVYEDYEALCAAINRALEDGIPITTPSYYKDITMTTMRTVFRSCNQSELPLLEQRTRNLQEAGKILHDSYGESFANFLTACDGHVVTAIERIAATFTSFRDVGVYNGQQVSFYKRAQILLADIWACFENKSYGHFHNIRDLTMFADYRVPQALLSFGILSYSQELMAKVREGTELEMFSAQEMEIRGCSIHAVELLGRAVKEVMARFGCHADINAVVLDFYLWDFATSSSIKEFPEHRTRSMFY